jgi:hypothetical protein
VPIGANTHKMHGLVALFGMDTPVFDPTRLHEQRPAIVDQTRHVLANESALRARQRLVAERLRGQARNHLRWLSAGRLRRP